MAQDRLYNISVNIYYAAAVIDVVKGCNGFMFTNTGDTVALVNGMVINPGVPGASLGDSRSIGGNEDEIYIGRIQIAFAIPGGVNPQVEIVQKFFSE
jgi:hypothetical protein